MGRSLRLYCPVLLTSDLVVQLRKVQQVCWCLVFLCVLIVLQIAEEGADQVFYDKAFSTKSLPSEEVQVQLAVLKGS